MPLPHDGAVTNLSVCAYTKAVRRMKGVGRMARRRARKRRPAACGCCRDCAYSWGFIPLWVGGILLLLVFCPFPILLALIGAGLVTCGVYVLRC